MEKGRATTSTEQDLSLEVRFFISTESFPLVARALARVLHLTYKKSQS